MNETFYTTVSTNEAGQRLDNYLIRILKGVPKSHIYRIIRAGEVRVNKKRASHSLHLVLGDAVRIPPLQISANKFFSINNQLKEQLLKSILFEDKELLVINKPPYMAVHGGSGISIGIIEALREIRQDLPYLELIHRLDRDTSGCLLIAKKRSFLRAIHALFMQNTVKKIYWALLTNPWQNKQEKVIVKVPIKKYILRSGERLVGMDQDGKYSQTTFKLLKNYQQACLVEALPKTGRTHQIRVHSAYLGHAVVGDEKYGGQQSIQTLASVKSRLYLHALAIQFSINGKNYHFKAHLDKQFTQVLNKLPI